MEQILNEENVLISKCVHLGICDRTVTHKVTLGMLINRNQQAYVHICMCAQRRFKSDCVSAKSDQSLSFPPEETLDHWLYTERPSKTLIRQCECTGSFESPDGHTVQLVHCTFCWKPARITLQQPDCARYFNDYTVGIASKTLCHATF